MSARCRNCGVELIAVTRREGRICLSCARIAHRERARHRYLTDKASRSGTPATYLVADDAFRRQKADATLNCGRCKRRCPECARLYCPDCLEAPCPVCGNHLSDNPLEVSHGQAA